MRKMSKWTKVGLVIGIVAFMLGCTIGTSMRLPQTHFSYPNSNVKPIGPTSGSASEVCGILFFIWGDTDGSTVDDAIANALQKSGGDLIINVKMNSGELIIPYIVAICKTTVSGTAATMKVGEQQLR